MGSIPPVQSNTVITPPVGSFDPSRGNMAVKLSDRDPGVAPENVAGVLVSLVGPGVNESVSTTAEGCGFFDADPAGLVHRATRQHRVGRPAGCRAPDPDRRGHRRDDRPRWRSTTTRPRRSPRRLTAAGGGTLPSASWAQIPIVLGNTDFLPTGTKTFSGTGTTRTLSFLFPSSTGYTAVAGACADADNGADALSVTRNTTTSATIPLATVDVQFSEFGTDGPDDIVAVHASDAGCPSGQTITLGTVPDGVATLLAALPYGTWQLRVPGHSPVGSWPTVTLDPTGAAVTFVSVQI